MPAIPLRRCPRLVRGSFTLGRSTPAATPTFAVFSPLVHLSRTSGGKTGRTLEALGVDDQRESPPGKRVASSPAEQPHGSLLCFSLIVLAVFIRGGVLVAQHDRLRADPDGYRTLAQNLAEHGVLGRGSQPSAYRPPLYPLALAPCVAGPWKPEAAIALVHFALGLATVATTVWLAKRWGLGSFSYLAGALVACDPILVNQSTLVMTETLATFLAVASLAFISTAS